MNDGNGNNNNKLNIILNNNLNKIKNNKIDNKMKKNLNVKYYIFYSFKIFNFLKNYLFIKIDRYKEINI